MLTKCKNCSVEIEKIEGKEPKQFCGDACRKAFSRRASTTDIPASNIGHLSAVEPTSDNIGQNGLTKLTHAEELYAKINGYDGDTWKDSPEYKELIATLEEKSVEDLKKEGYWIPAWKRGNDK